MTPVVCRQIAALGVLLFVLSVIYQANRQTLHSAIVHPRTNRNYLHQLARTAGLSACVGSLFEQDIRVLGQLAVSIQCLTSPITVLHKSRRVPPCAIAGWCAPAHVVALSPCVNDDSTEWKDECVSIITLLRLSKIICRGQRRSHHCCANGRESHLQPQTTCLYWTVLQPTVVYRTAY